jgi:hypothetical protein
MTSYQGNIVIKNPATPTGPAETGSAPGIWKLNEALAFKRQGIWPTQGVIPADPYFSYTTLLLSTTSLGNANNNLFVDSSGAFNPISRNGNTTQGSATPYGANWSNYFDGSGDWVQFASTSQFAIATSTTPFTIEAWIYPTAAGSCIFTDSYTGSGDPIPICISLSNGVSVDAISGRYVALGYYTGSAWVTAAKANAEVSLNTWTHIACVFTGSTFKIYYNGVDVTAAGAGSSWGVTGNAGSAWYIGRRWDISANDYFTGYISNLRFVNGTAVYTSAFTPSTTPLTAITNTVLLTAQSNRFRDASTNNFTATPNGNTSVTDFSPFSPGSPGIVYNQSDTTNWSGYFDGDGDYLSIPNNAAFSYGTGDFTVEAWVYKTATSGDRAVLDSYTIGSGSGTFGFLINNTQINAYQTNVATYTFTYTVPNNSWNHIAFVRTGGNLICYVNGTSIGSQANSANFISSSTVQIGRNAGSGGSQWIGYISNLRIVKGTAVYTANFTPSTTNLTAISGTSLLTLQNAAFTDNSTNNFVITPFGNTTVTGNSPFNTVGYWSNYFDGTDDYLSLSASSALNQSGDFTIEAWIYLTATPSATTPIYAFEVTNFMKFGINTSRNLLVDQANVGVKVTGSTALNLSTWYHMAFVRSGSGSNNCKIYLNGVQEGQFTDTSTATASGTGRICSRPDATSGFLTCYLSNLRVTNTAVYTTAFTPSTTPLTAISGTQLLTCQASRLIDSSTNAISLTRNGDVSVQSFDPFYTATIASNGGSMYLDGTGDYLSAGSSPNFAFGSGAFTVECWFYATTSSTSQSLMSTDVTNGFFLAFDGPLTFGIRGVAGILSFTPSNYINAWSHIAVSRSGGTISMFFNGTRVATTSNSTNFSLTGPLIVGGLPAASGFYWTGYIANARITNGTAIYSPSSTSITVPTTPLAPSGGTTLLVNGMNAGAYDATAINDMETVGNAQVSTAVSKFGGSSMYFDGTGDYLLTPSNPAYGLASSNFTIEAWVYVTSSSEPYQPVVKAVGSGSNNLMFIDYSGGSTGVLSSQSGGTAATRSGVTLNTWHHLAVVRNGTSVTCYVNGVGGTSQTIDPGSSGSVSLLVGYDGGTSPARYFNGYIDDLRVTRGVARYTANFTPPTQAFPPY